VCKQNDCLDLALMCTGLLKGMYVYTARESPTSTLGMVSSCMLATYTRTQDTHTQSHRHTHMFVCVRVCV